jgi:hypothetical protein
MIREDKPAEQEPHVPVQPSTFMGLLATMVSTDKALVEAERFLDGDKQVFSFQGNVLKCDGFFSHEQLYKDVAKNLTWIVIVGLILAVVFTIVLNSYWPILISMYNALKKLVRQGKEGSKNQIQLIQFQGSQSSKEEEEEEESEDKEGEEE